MESDGRLGLMLLGLVLGLLVGGTVGTFLGGTWITLSDRSCSEGVCGVAVAGWMGAGLLAGPVVGGVMGWRRGGVRLRRG